MASKHFQVILYENCHSFMQISLKCVPITMFEIVFLVHQTICLVILRKIIRHFEKKIVTHFSLNVN